MTEEEDSLTPTDLHFLEDIDIDAIVKYLDESDNVMCQHNTEYSIGTRPQTTQDEERNIHTAIEINNTFKQKNKEFVSNESVNKTVENKNSSETIDQDFTNVFIETIKLSDHNNQSKSNTEKSENILYKLAQETETCNFMKQIKHDDLLETCKIINLKQDHVSALLDTFERGEHKLDTTSNNTNVNNTKYVEIVKPTVHNNENIKEEINEFIKTATQDLKKSNLTNEVVSNHNSINITNKVIESNDTSNLASLKDMLNENGVTPKKTSNNRMKAEMNSNDCENNSKTDKNIIKTSCPSLDLASTKEKSVKTQNITKRFMKLKDDIININKKIQKINSSLDLAHTPTKQMSEKQNNLNITKNVTANSVVVRMDDLHLLEKLEIQLHQNLCKKFTDLSIIRYGKYSKIFKCKRKDTTYTVKVINDDLNIKRLGADKESMLNRLQNGIPKHELFCINILASFALEKHWCFLFDYYPKNLKEELKLNGPMHINVVQHLSKQLIAALKTLRAQNIVHSHMKPAHILLNESNDMLKVCGFDNAYYIAEVNMLPNIGSPNYRAPEVILGYSAAFSVDIWSTGLIMYEMVANHRLFPGYFNNDILYKQMCILGNMPIDMIRNSIYGHNHFKDGVFLKRNGYKIQEIRHSFYRNNTYTKTLYKIHNQRWKYLFTTSQGIDMKKINSLIKLLKKMIVLHPLNRIPIEFVPDDPFI